MIKTKIKIKIKIKRTLACLLLLASGFVAVGQSPMPPALYVKAGDLATALAETNPQRPNMAVGRVSVGENYRINLIRRTAAAGAILHEVGSELHFITEGAGTLVTGGVIVRPADGGSATIEGGLAQRVTVGDAILIPVGTPHWYSAVEGVVSYLEVRFNE